MMFDLFIIGGGINGCGIARDASGRGLSVCLCEQNDLASGTSSQSTKLIHGGLRYLEQFQFRLVQDAMREQRRLMDQAPHLISPQTFVLIHHPKMRPAWMIQLGLWIYEHLAQRHSSLPKPKRISLRTHAVGEPLQPQYSTGFIYGDAWGDDARLVISNALSAKEKGATILTQHRVVKTILKDTHWEIHVHDKASKQEKIFQARTLVNASGPWQSQVAAEVEHRSAPPVQYVKGSHIVIPKCYEGDQAYVLQQADERIIFVIPYEKDFLLVGTTDEVFSGDPAKAAISESEIQYLQQALQTYFKPPMGKTAIVHTFAGVRALVGSANASLSKLSRDFAFEVKKPNQHCTHVVIESGKITTYRKLSEEVMNALLNASSAWTANAFLAGGDLPTATLEAFIDQKTKAYPWLPFTLLKRYCHTYGTQIDLLLQDCNSMASLGRCISRDLYEVEWNYCCQQEWAKTDDDILWRRTKLGLWNAQPCLVTSKQSNSNITAND